MKIKNLFKIHIDNLFEKWKLLKYQENIFYNS